MLVFVLIFHVLKTLEFEFIISQDNIQWTHSWTDYMSKTCTWQKKEFIWIKKSRFKVQAWVFLFFSPFVPAQYILTSDETNICHLKGSVSFSGTYLLLIGGRIKVSQWAELFSTGKGSIYLARPLSTCFLPWADPMVNPFRMKWKRILLHFFFSYNDAPGAIVSWQNLQRGTGRKNKALQLHGCDACGSLKCNKDQHKCKILIARIKLNAYLRSNRIQNLCNVWPPRSSN